MDAAKKGSANASIRRILDPISMTRGSGDRSPIISAENTYIRHPVTVIMIIASAIVMYDILFTRSFLFAPTLWPIRVVAAADIP